jgi:hypothetical protein
VDDVVASHAGVGARKYTVVVDIVFIRGPSGVGGDMPVHGAVLTGWGAVHRVVLHCALVVPSGVSEVGSLQVQSAHVGARHSEPIVVGVGSPGPPGWVVVLTRGQVSGQGAAEVVSVAHVFCFLRVVKICIRCLFESKLISDEGSYSRVRSERQGSSHGRVWWGRGVPGRACLCRCAAGVLLTTG